MKRSETEEPQLSMAAFERRSKTLAVKLAQTLDMTIGEISLQPEISDHEATLSLSGRASETITRNRGKHRVIALCDITGDVFAWIGYRERWQKKSAERNFRFVEGGFTLHVGRVGEIKKPQILRSEWIGRRSDMFGNKAGHPHWQLDVLESARKDLIQPAKFAEGPTVPVEFAVVGEEEPFGENLLFGLTLERMHLASAALWWCNPSVPIAYPPEDVADVDRWIVGCMTYLQQEVGRCTVVGVPSRLVT